MRIVALLMLPILAMGTTAAGADLAAIREAARQLRAYEPPEVGLLLPVAPDVYSTGGEQPEGGDPVAAKKLMELATQAAELGEAALAIRLATQAVLRDPDCRAARLALGYEQRDGRWLTSYQARMAERGNEWHPQYGWIRAGDLPRYEAGERRYRGRWVTAEVDARQHDTIATGWQVRTDHFNVTTNHSLGAGAALAAKLETLYQVWQQLLADYHVDDRQLHLRFSEHRVPGVRSRPFQVVYHRSQAEYQQALVARQPRIAETIGIYFDRQREAHFFYAGDATAATDATLYHEAVHQFFQESARVPRGVGQRDNFWAIEGVATYFESLRRHQAKAGRVLFTIGEAGAGRLPAARQRLLADGYRVPLAELVTLGKTDLQRRTDLAPLYSQAAGLATFFLADDQRRGVFVEYLRQIYAGEAQPGTLARLAGRSYAELDADYREFLEKLPQTAASVGGDGRAVD